MTPNAPKHRVAVLPQLPSESVEPVNRVPQFGQPPVVHRARVERSGFGNDYVAICACTAKSFPMDRESDAEAWTCPWFRALTVAEGREP